MAPYIVARQDLMDGGYPALYHKKICASFTKSQKGFFSCRFLLSTGLKCVILYLYWCLSPGYISP